MKPSIHVIVSLTLSALFWFFTKSLYASFACFISGVLVDLDHLIEFFIHYEKKDFTLRKFFSVCRQMLFEKLYLFFHSCELLILLWLSYSFSKNVYLLAISIGYSSHLILDYIGNPLHVYSYFFIRRFMRKFETREILKNNFPFPDKKI